MTQLRLPTREVEVGLMEQVRSIAMKDLQRGLSEASWAHVLERMQEYEPWRTPRLVLDTANTVLNAWVRQALLALQPD